MQYCRNERVRRRWTRLLGWLGALSLLLLTVLALPVTARGTVATLAIIGTLGALAWHLLASDEASTPP
jgi:hypothetical protein